MKKILFTILIIFIGVFTAGCIKFDTEITIDKKGNASINDKLLVSSQLLALSDVSASDLDSDRIRYLKNSSIETQKSQIEDGDYQGIEYKTKIKNIAKNDLIDLFAYFYPNEKGLKDFKYIKVNKNIYNSSYFININVDFKDIKDERGKRVFTRDAANYISSKLTVNIPVKATKTNASSVTNDGLTHIWNFNVANKYNVLLEFNIVNYLNIILTVISLFVLIFAYVLKYSKLAQTVRNSLFGISGILFIYFVLAQILYSIQSLSVTPLSICFITIFSCLAVVAFLPIIKTENLNCELNINNESLTDNQNSDKNGTKNCPFCGGEVPVTVKKCKHCGEWLINEKDSKKENKIAQKKINPEIQKTVNIILRTVLVILLITAVVLGINKSGLSDFVQNKVAELHMNEIEKIIKTANETKQGYEDVGQENTIYKLMEKDYNQISSFKDKQTGANTYAFRVQTDVKIFNNDTNFFEYELGRIIINPKDIQKSKCTYNFRASLDNNPVKWVECSDKSFIDSIPKIAELKNKSYQQYKNNEYRKLINLFSECNSEGFYNSKCDTLPNNSSELIDGWYSGHHEFLEKLRSTTL